MKSLKTEWNLESGAEIKLIVIFFCSESMTLFT